MRRLSVQSVLSAFGEGVFLTGSAVFFTHIVGLTAAQVGLGLTISGLATFLFAVPLGKLADRYGAKNVWALSAFLEALAYLVWPLLGSMAAYVVMMIALGLMQSTNRAARNAYRLDVFPREERVSSQAYFRAARNVGYTLGALLGGLALAFESDAVVRAVPLFTAALLLLNAAWITRMPPIVRVGPSDPDVGDGAVGEGDGGVDAVGPPEVPVRSALRDRPFLAMCFFDGVLGTHQVLLNVVIPLWLVQETDAPRVLLAWLFGTNTVMAVLLQVAAARGITTVADSLRAQRRGATFFILSCGIVLVTHDTVGWITIALVWVGHVTVTGAELFQSAGQWGLIAELSDSERRGEYQGVAQLGYTLGTVWAPAAYTFLAMEWGTRGWLLIAAIIASAAVGIHLAARTAERALPPHRRPALAGVE